MIVKGLRGRRSWSV